jgi:CLIP-associating protein 1/2
MAGSPSSLTPVTRSAPNAAKSELKKQLKNFKVRPAIEQAIVNELAPTSGRPETPAEPAAAPVRPALGASVTSLSAERPMTPMLAENKPEAVDPAYVNTQRELDDIFRDMQFHFEGRETEQNWLKREESVTKLRKLLAGNAPSDYPDHFITGLRGLLDGIIKAVTSLRTSLSKEGCSLIQEVAITFGPAMDPMVELLMQTFIKLCAATKKIASQLANITVDTIIGRASYNMRIMQHIWGACQDKNVQPRTYASGWLKTLLKKEAHHKSHIEHTGGLDVIEKCIKKGLNDANPGVREQMRATYWTYAAIWPAKAEA